MAHLFPTVIVSPGSSTPDVAHWCTPVGCVPHHVVEMAFVGVIGAFSLLALVGFALTYLPDARDRVAVERARTRAERDAFEAFAERVERLDASRPTAAAATTADRTLVRGDDAASTDDVRTAYRETVMAVDHYAEEYDEPLPTNVEVEFGPDVAAAVTEDQPLSPHVQHAVLEGSKQAMHERETHVEILDDEDGMLSDAEDTLDAVETETDEHAAFRETWPFPLLADTYSRLDRLEARCRDLLAHRQEALVGEPFGPNTDPFELHAYLYADFPVRHPVLAEAVTVLEEVRSVRRDVLRALAY